MRKYLLVLLAGVAAPAIAAADPGDNNHRWHHDSGQQSQSEDRGDRSSGNSDRPHFNRGGGEQAQPVTQVETNGGGNNDRPHFNRDSGGNESQPAMHVETNNGGNSGEHRFYNGFRSRFSGSEQSAIQPTGGDRSGSPDTVRTWRSEERQRMNNGPKIVEPTDVAVSPTLRQQDRELPRVFRNRVPVVSNTPREGTQPPLRTEGRRIETANWSANWRNDHRYDWRTHRRHHHSLFHLGFYYDPFGWNYRPYQIGWRLWPSYYSSRYWIDDPWQYRLPYAPPGYRWVRYWDDALLVDTWSGQVVDVLYNFFW
ncbi:MAG TPA: RcnB family protein [Sphingomicrobium sp.]